MNAKDQIQELFSSKLSGHETPVRSELWQNVASQIGATGAAASAGLSLATKIFIGVGAASIVTVGVIIGVQTSNSTEEDSTPAVAMKETQAPQKTDETPAIEKTDAFIVDTEEENIPNTQEAPQQGSIVQGEERISQEDEPSNIGYSEEDLRTAQAIAEEHKSNQDASSVENEYKEQANQEANSEQKPGSTEEGKEEQVTERSHFVEMDVNIFTPDGDGVNDVLKLRAEGVKDFSIFVRNKDGVVVFTSDDPNFEWDGLDMGGNPVPDGDYMYGVMYEGLEKPIYQRLKIKRAQR